MIPFHERELETGWLPHIGKFLLELGRGFAFVGRQYELIVSDREYFLDLLFYHLADAGHNSLLTGQIFRRRVEMTKSDILG